MSNYHSFWRFSLVDVRQFALLFILLGVHLITHSQQVYRIVGSDGKVTFSDRPPVSSSEKAAQVKNNPNSSSPQINLPFEIKQIADKYPVMFYSSDACQPCTLARSFLVQRGIPFSEKTIKTPEDQAAFKKLNSTLSLPFLTIGTQQLKGFSEKEWSEYLTAAGYPNESKLPNNYKSPAPESLAPSTESEAETQDDSKKSK